MIPFQGKEQCLDQKFISAEQYIMQLNDIMNKLQYFYYWVVQKVSAFFSFDFQVCLFNVYYLYVMNINQ